MWERGTPPLIASPAAGTGAEAQTRGAGRAETAASPHAQMSQKMPCADMDNMHNHDQQRNTRSVTLQAATQ